MVSVYGDDLRAQASKVVAVTLSGQAATIKRESNFLVTVEAGKQAAGAAGDVILTADTGAVVTKSKAWAYVEEGSITKVSPASAAAGAVITITGTGLRSGSKKITSVAFGAFAASIQSESDTTVVVKAGVTDSSQARKLDITLTSGDGATVVLKEGFEYLTQSDIHSVSPSQGQYLTKVTIEGVELLAGAAKLTSVTLSGVKVKSITSQTKDKVVVVADKSAKAVVGDVILTAANGATVSLVNGFSYVGPAVMTAATPADGQIGTVVQIKGQNLLAGASKVISVNLAGTAVQKIVAFSNTVVTVIAASGSPGAGIITMTMDSGATTASANNLWTYRTQSKITGVVPAKGQDKTKVVIAGSNFHGGGAKVTKVLLGDSTATITAETNTEVTVVASSGAKGTGAVVLQANTGATTTLADAFTYLDVAVIKAVAPATGQLNTKVTITGTNMLGGGAKFVSITLAGTAATIASGSDTQAVVVIKTGTAGAGKVVMTADSGAQVTSTTNLYTQLTDGKIAKVDPAKGVLGSRVTVTGASLLAGDSKLASVTLDGVAAQVTSLANTKITLIANDAKKGTAASVVITATTGATITAEKAWTYLEPGTITKVTPNQGQVGTSVTIEGTSLFAGGASIKSAKLNGVSVASVDNTQSAEKIVVVAAAGTKSIGATDIVMISDIGTTITGKSKWTYLEQGTIASLKPETGRENTVVTISGERMRGGGNAIKTVALGNTGSKINSQTDTEVVVVVNNAAATSDPVDVKLVSDTGATVTKAKAWKYTDNKITKVSPSVGQIGVRVTITGVNMLADGTLAKTTLAGVTVASTVSSSESSIVVRAASGKAGTGAVVLTSTTGATITKDAGFTYQDASEITSIKPSAGQLGTKSIIAGTLLLGKAAANTDTVVSVKLGSVAATITKSSQTEVAIIVKSGDAGNVDVVLEATSGATTTSKGGFTYTAVGVIKTVTPNVGQLGTVVVINGERLLGGGAKAASVTLVGETTTIKSSGATEVVVQASASAKTDSGDIVIVADTGAIVTGNGLFTYKTPSKISAIKPAVGQLGTSVTISGTTMRANANSVDSVTLAGVSATITKQSDDTVVVVAQKNDAKTGDVVVVADSGASVTETNGFTYKAQGSVSSVAPVEGQTGTIVVIKGTSLRGQGSKVASVTLGKVAASIKSETDGQVVVAAGSGPADKTTDLDVVLVADTGAQVTKAKGWTYLLPGVIKLVKPNKGQTDTKIDITGERLCGGGLKITKVTLCGKEARIVDPNCNLVQVRANELGTQTTGAVVLVSDTGSVVTLDKAFTYVGAGSIAKVTPSKGQGTTSVTITGTSLLGGGSKATKVTLAGVTAQIEGDATDNTKLVVRANAGPVALNQLVGDVVVTSDVDVSITAVNAFEYSVITAVAPSVGQGGTHVTISGNALLGDGSAVKKVLLDNVEAQVKSSSATSVVVVAKAIDIGQAQSGTVKILLNSGQEFQSVALQDDSFVKQFSYKVAGKITSVAPTQGQKSTKVVIKGTSLFGQGASLASVTLAGVKADIKSSSNTAVEVEAGTSGKTASGAVTLTADTGAVVTIATKFNYVAVGVIAKVDPPQGQDQATVTLTGTDLMSGGTTLTSVTMAGVKVAKIVSASATKVVVVAAKRDSAGKGDIVLLSENGAQTVLTNGFEYVAVPAFTKVEPATGQTNTRVTITGTGLRSGAGKVAKVTLKGVAAAITSESDTKLVVVCGTTASAGKGDIVVTASTGAVTTGTGLFTALAEGAISSVTPGKGQAATKVVIAGSNLFAGGSNKVAVTLASIAVASITSAANDKVAVVVKSGQAGTGDVVITASTGATVTKKNAWTQLEDGTITEVKPNKGHEGTRVDIIGQRLLGGGGDVVSITLAGVKATYKATSGSASKLSVVSNKGINAGQAGDVTLTSDSGAVITLAGGFTHVAQASITKLTPNSGQGGTACVITGTGLLGGGSKIVSVKLVGVEVESIDKSTDDEVSVTVKTSTQSSKGDVTLVADSGATVTATGAFTYVTLQKIETIAPNKGQHNTVVTVKGTNLFGGGSKVKSITLAGEAPASIVSQNNGAVVVTLKDIAAKKGAVVITADSGAVVTSADGSFEYLTKGVITKVDPSKGQRLSLVTIEGERLLGGGASVAKLTLAGLAATVKSASATKIVLNAAGSDKTVDEGDVVIVSNTGATVSKAKAWSYFTPGAILKVEVHLLPN